MGPGVSTKKMLGDMTNAQIAILPKDDVAPEGYRGVSRSFDFTAEGLAAWAKSSAYRSVLSLAKSYNAYHSLQSNNSRALLYHIIMTLRPERVS